MAMAAFQSGLAIFALKTYKYKCVGRMQDLPYRAFLNNFVDMVIEEEFIRMWRMFTTLTSSMRL